MITIIGLGVENGDLSRRAEEALRSGKRVLLRTALTQSAKALDELGIAYTSLDSVYEKSRHFDSLRRNIASEVRKAERESGDVIYCVDGSVSEDGAAGLLMGRNVAVIDGPSKAAYFAAHANVTGYTALSAYDYKTYLRAALPLVVYDLDNRFLAGDVKMELGKLIGEESDILFLHGADQKTIKLYELDRQDTYDYRTGFVVYERDLLEKSRFDYTDLLELIRRLRAPDGCPWDRVQTHESLRKQLVEESYELVDAIDSGDSDKIREETGDVLLQAAFHTILKEEEGEFDSSDVLTEVCAKLIFRHSH
ncbi:MAG: MazG nucleotide pyrophosphohydrolase domain-containing protein, partial [Christensenellaceae bacterium]